VLYELSIAPQRFNEPQRLNQGISHKVLAGTLRRFERDGLISRSVSDGAVYPNDPFAPQPPDV